MKGWNVGETKEINGFQCFKCVPTGCWMTEHGCKAVRRAADSAAYSIKAGMDFNKIDEICLKRVSECCVCAFYKTLGKEEFMAYLKAAFDQKLEMFEAKKIEDDQESFYETKRRQWRQWYWRQKKKEDKNG